MTTDLNTYTNAIEKEDTYANHIVMHVLGKNLHQSIKIIQTEGPDTLLGHNDATSAIT